MHKPANRPRLVHLLRTSVAAITRSLAFVALAALTLTPVPMHAQDRAAVHKVPPQYPALARQLGIAGTVVVTTTVDPSGKVVHAESNSGNKLLASAAIYAVKQWKFAPGDATDTFPISVVFEKDQD